MVTRNFSVSNVSLSIGLILLAALIVSGCASQPATEPPNVTVPQEPTIIPPTITSAPNPTVAIGPEFQAASSQDINGVWVLKLPSDAAGSAGTAHLEFKLDGTYSLIGVSGPAEGATIDSGSFSFENGQLKLESTGGCLDPITAQEINPCIGIYKVFVAKQGDRPAYIKFSVVDDNAGDRKNALNNHKLLSAQS